MSGSEPDSEPYSFARFAAACRAVAPADLAARAGVSLHQANAARTVHGAVRLADEAAMTRAPASAKGLFRATGKRPRPVQALLGDGEIAVVDPATIPRDPRDPLDFDPTPPEPTFAFCAAEADRLSAFPAIWEAACGDGRMMRDLEACGHRVVGSDIVDRGAPGAIIRDFFAFDAPLAPAIVTNPPYNKVNAREGRGGAWITHARERLGVEYMALLLAASWPQPMGLGAPPNASAWFVWDRRTHPDDVRYLRLGKRDPRTRGLFGEGGGGCGGPHAGRRPVGPPEKGHRP